MIDELKKLLGLQNLDDACKRLEAEQAALPEKRERVAQERLAIEEKLATGQEALHEAQGNQRAAESALRDQETLLEKLEGQQHQVKTNEAYTALLHEMEQARGEVSDCETRILEAMEAIEEALGTVAGAERAAEKGAGRLDEQSSTLDARETELEASITRIREERDAIRPGLEASLVSQYDRIATRRWPAISVVDKEMCLGCRVDIPPQSYIEILRGARVITCGHCARILVHREKIEATG